METTQERPKLEGIRQFEPDKEVANHITGETLFFVDLDESQSNLDNILRRDISPASYSLNQSDHNFGDVTIQSNLEITPNLSFDQSKDFYSVSESDLIEAAANIQAGAEPGIFNSHSLDNVDPHQPQDMVEEAAASSLCKYRWTKTWDIKSGNIGFYPSYSPKNPVLLSWNEKDAAYFSDDQRVLWGDYQGHLVLEGKVYPTEEFSVRSYTFEVDLFTKEDLVADDMPGSQSEQKELKSEQHNDSSLVQTYKDFGTVENSEPCTISSLDFGNLNSKVVSNIEELECHKMAEDEALLIDVQRDGEDNLLSSSVKSCNDISLTNMKRDSPIGNDDDGKFSEFNFRYSSSESFEKSQSSPEQLTHSNDAFIKSLSQVLDRAEAEMEVVEDVVKPSSTRESIGSEIRVDAKENLRGSRPPSIGADFILESRQGSLKHSQSMDSIYCRSQSKDSDRFSPDSLKNTDPARGDSSRYRPTHEQVPERPRASASPALMIQTTPSKERSSQVLGSVPSSPRGADHRELVEDNIYSRKGKILENGEVGSADSSLIGRPPSHPGSRSGSLYPSRAQSLNSMTSDQELAQLFEHSRPNSSHSQPRSIHSVDMKGSERPSNVPTWISQPEPFKSYPSSDAEKMRDTHSRSSSVEKMRDTHSRSSSVSRVSTHGSSRAATPVPSDHGTKDLNSDLIKDLEASVTNLRKLLSGREAEVHSLTSQLADLKDVNRSLREELDHRGRRHTPVSSLHESFEYKQLQSEKEILASEVVTLKDELQRLNKRRAADHGHRLAGSEITDYSPNSPAVLQRKIVDLEAHIRDLQEVNESTNSSLLQAEKKLKLLQHENKELKSRAHNLTDTQNQGDHDSRVELRTLREDIRNLKERNYQLTEENMRIQEGQRSSSKETSSHSSSVGSRLGSFRSDNADARKTSGYTTAASYRYETAPASLEAPDRGRTASASHATSKKVSHEDLAPREIRQSALNLNQRAAESHHPQYQNSSDSYLHHYQQRNGSGGSKSIESMRRDLQHSDRSTPDGEVSEKLHLDKYAKLLPSYERRSYEYKTGDGGSYLDKHSSYKPRLPRELMDIWPREKSDVRDKGDKYRHIKEGQLDSNTKLSSHDRLPLSAPTISSRDIFFNVQQRRAGHWSQQDERNEKLPSLSDDHDSDSTQVLMAGHRSDLAGKDSSLSQMSSKIKEDKQREIATDGHSQNPTFSLENKYMSGNLDFQRYQSTRASSYSNLGDDSDTATDILIGQDISHKGLSHKRRSSLGSEGSPSSLSDIEDSTDILLRRRSKSTDAKAGHNRQLLNFHRSESASRPLTTTEQTARSAGFRSVIPAPLVTQHNKAEITSKSITSLLSSSLTQGMRPFAPRSPADIRADDVVKFSRLGGKLTQGIVKYVGRLPGRSEAYLGVELDKDEGKHDGTFEGVRYFKCKPNKGVFVAFNKVVMCWAP